SICKRIWLRKLSRNRNKSVALTAAMDIGEEADWEEQWLRTRKWTLFQAKFKELADECRKVLQMLFNGKSGKEIATSMGYSEEYAKRKKYKCKQHLAGLIKQDPEYKTLTTDGI
ncbi:MAG: hypothetical protein AAFO94_18925, partial [Bacteroidota bacterium]